MQEKVKSLKTGNSTSLKVLTNSGIVEISTNTLIIAYYMQNNALDVLRDNYAQENGKSNCNKCGLLISCLKWFKKQWQLTKKFYQLQQKSVSHKVLHE